MANKQIDLTLQEVEKIKEMCLKLNVISVYDLDVYTSMELYYMLANKINEVITELWRFETTLSSELIEQNKNLEYMLNEGLVIEVSDKILDLIENGVIKNIINKEIFNDLEEQITHIATIPKGFNIAQEINELINKNVKSIKIPKGKHYVSESIKLKSGVQITSDKGGVLYTDKDIPIITTQDENVNYDDIFLYGLNIRQEYTGVTSYPSIDLKNANMCRVERVHCYTSNTHLESVTGLKVYSTLSNIANHGGIFSILIDKCDFRNSSIDINITDCYITNTNVWGVNRQYAIHLGKSSQQINNCQIVGGDTKGAIWVEDIDDGYNIEIIKITNCYFDGSYEDVKSGIGLNAKQMRYSNVSNCSFWYQKKDGMLLDGCFGNTFVGLTFEGSGRNNLSRNDYNNCAGYADIKIVGDTYDNIFSNIIFAAEGDYYIKNKAIKGIDTQTFENHYNILSNLTIVDYNKYNDEAYDFNFPYIGTNIKGANLKINNIVGNLIIKGEIQATTGFKTSLIFSHNEVVNGISTLINPNGQSKNNYLVCNNGNLVDIGVNVETPISTGTITLQVLRGSDILAEQIMDKNTPYFKITNFAYGDKKIYKGDLLKVKLITSADLNNCAYLTATINITQ